MDATTQTVNSAFSHKAQPFGKERTTSIALDVPFMCPCESTIIQTAHHIPNVEGAMKQLQLLEKCESEQKEREPWTWDMPEQWLRTTIPRYKANKMQVEDELSWCQQNPTFMAEWRRYHNSPPQRAPEKPRNGNNHVFVFTDSEF